MRDYVGVRVQVVENGSGRGESGLGEVVEQVALALDTLDVCIQPFAKVSIRRPKL